MLMSMVLIFEHCCWPFSLDTRWIIFFVQVTSLLYNFLNNCCFCLQRALFEEGCIYVGVPPLYKVWFPRNSFFLNKLFFFLWLSIGSIFSFVWVFRLRGESRHTIASMMQNSETSRVHFLQMHHITFRGSKVRLSIYTRILCLLK